MGGLWEVGGWVRGVRTWGGEVEGAVVEAAGEGEDEGLHFLRVETGFECEGVLERRVGGWVDVLDLI